jgi:hypothetical protein
MGGRYGRTMWVLVSTHLVMEGTQGRDGAGIFRATNVLKHYRGFEMPRGAKFEAWLERLFEHPAFKKTCSDEELYLDSYER